MKKLLDPGYWLRALQSPVVLLGLAIDLIPIYAVLAWGWTAAPLVLLYWLENVVAGVMTLPRILISGAVYGWRGVLMALFLCAFFTFHYGLFCYVHGIFLQVFLLMSDAWTAPAGPDMGFMDGPFAMIASSLASGQNMIWVVGVGAAFQLLLLVWQYGVKGEWKTSNPMTEMFSPYARIVVLHIGIFAGAGALVLLGEPMIGVLGLILFRAAWGVLSRTGSGPFVNLDSLEMTPEQRQGMEAILGAKLPEKETVRRYDP